MHILYKVFYTYSKISQFLWIYFNEFFGETLVWQGAQQYLFCRHSLLTVNISVKRKSCANKFLNLSGFKSRKFSSPILSVATWLCFLMLHTKWMLLDTKLLYMLAFFILWFLTFLLLWDVKTLQSFDLNGVRT